MRQPSVFYARYLAKPNTLGMYPGRKPTDRLEPKKSSPRPTGPHAIMLYMIEQWYPDPGGERALGEPFTLGEFISRYNLTREKWDSPPCHASTLKARIKYLYERGYLAKAYIGASTWYHCISGTEVELGSKIDLAEYLPPPNPELTHINPSMLPTPAPEVEGEDALLKALREHGYLK